MAKKRQRSLYDSNVGKYVSGQYDQQFIEDVSTAVTPDQYIQQDSFSLSNQDYLSGNEDPYTYKGGLNTSSEDPFNELRSERQGVWDELTAGTGRVGSKIAREALITLGAIGGTAVGLLGQTEDLITGEDNTTFLSTAFNNSFIKAIDDNFDKFNEENLPVYVSDSIKNGGFFDKVTSGEFYATEGADGLGYMVSAFGPGLAAKALGLGNKIFRAGVGVNKVLFGGNVRKARKAMGIMNANKIDEMVIPAFNTWFEAGAEGKGVENTLNTPENIKKYNENNFGTKQHQAATNAKLKDLDLQRQQGKIDIDQYNQLSATAAEDSLEEMRQKHVADAVTNTVIKNAAILAGPNYIQAKILFGKNGATNLANKVATQAIDSGEKTSGKFLGKAFEAVTTGKTGKGLKRIGEGFVREGGEEVAQTSIEHRNVEDALKGNIGKSMINDYALDTFTKDFLHSVTTTEGQVAGFLGGILAAPISVFQGAKQDVRDQTKEAKLIQKIRTAGTSLNDLNLPIYETRISKNPETGEEFEETVMDENGPVQNKENIVKVGKAIKHHEELSKIYDKAVKEGDTETVENVKKLAEHDLIMNFINEDEMSLDALKQHLETIMPVNTEDKSKNNTNQKRTSDLIEKAKYLQKELVFFRDMSTSIIKIDDKTANKKEVESFMENLGRDFLKETSRAYDLNQALKKNEKAKAHLENQTRITEIPNPNYIEGVSHEMDKTVKTRINPRLDLVNKNIQRINEELDGIDKRLNKDIWDPKLINSTFKAQKNSDKKLQEELAPESVLKKDAKIAEVEKAKTREEVEAIDTEDEPVATTKKVNKQAVLTQKEKEERDAELEKEEALKAEEEELDVDLGNALSELEEELAGQEDVVEITEEVGEEIIEEQAETVVEVEEPIKKKGGRPKKIKDPITDETLEVVSSDKNAIKVKTEEGEIKQYPVKKEPGNGKAEDVVIEDPSPVLKGTSNSSSKTPGVATDEDAAAYISYMMEPRDKAGDKVSFSLNTINLEGSWKDAYDLYNKKLKEGFSKISKEERELLIKFLPLKTVFNNTNAAARVNNSRPGDLMLRESVVNALQEGLSLNQIFTEVENQEVPDFNSDVDENGKPAINNVLDFYDFKNIKNITNEVPLYHINVLGEKIRVSNASASFKFRDGSVSPGLSGEIFVVIKSPKGHNVPVKLNTNKLTHIQAKGVSTIYKMILDDPGLKRLSLPEKTGKEIDELYKSLSKEISILGKDLNTITFGQLLDFLVKEDSKHGREITYNTSAQDRNERIVSFMGIEYSLNNIEEVESFAKELELNKKHNVITIADESNPKVHFQNNEYLKYLFENKIVSSDLSTKEGERQFHQATYFKQGITGSELWIKSTVSKPEVKKINLNTPELQQAQKDLSEALKTYQKPLDSDIKRTNIEKAKKQLEVWKN